MTPYFRAFLLGLAVLLGTIFLCLRADAAALPPWEFIVELPEPGYRKADGTLLRFSEFMGTRIDWGTCMDGDRINEIENSHMVRSWGFKTRIRIPAGREACIQAIVLDPDGDEMGRSHPVRVTTTGPRKNPMAPIRIGF